MLAGERCVACRRDTPRVTLDEEAELLREIPEWGIVEPGGVRKLRRTYRFVGWKPAVQFANCVADLAESEDHHPVLQIAWGTVTVTWRTHEINGLHRNDFVMAARSDALFDPA